jgi:polyphosphate kinase
MKLAVADKYNSIVQKSDLVSRDLSWLTFNDRVLDQSKKSHRSIFEKLKFLAITASNLDEFFMIRVGSLYNYLDYEKERVDYSGLREEPFKAKLMEECLAFHQDQHDHFTGVIMPEMQAEHITLGNLSKLSEIEKEKVNDYFQKVIYPMLTPMVYDGYRTFPILMNKLLVFGVVTTSPGERKDMRKLSFVQIPANIPRFF